MGGGGGGSERIAREQLRMEQERQAAIKSGIGAVNAAFDTPERQKQYSDYLAAQRKLYFDQLANQQQDAQRQNKFALARSGLVGSREQVDRGSDLGKAYQKGVIEADRAAQSNLVGLQSADEGTRQSLIQLVQSGADATTASSSALRSMQSNLAGASANAKVDALGNVFGDFSDLYKRSRDRADERSAMQYLDQLYNTGSRWGYTPPAAGWR